MITTHSLMHSGIVGKRRWLYIGASASLIAAFILHGSTTLLWLLLFVTPISSFLGSLAQTKAGQDTTLYPMSIVDGNIPASLCMMLTPFLEPLIGFHTTIAVALIASAFFNLQWVIPTQTKNHYLAHAQKLGEKVWDKTNGNIARVIRSPLQDWAETTAYQGVLHDNIPSKTRQTIQWALQHPFLLPVYPPANRQNIAHEFLWEAPTSAHGIMELQTKMAAKKS